MFRLEIPRLICKKSLCLQGIKVVPIAVKQAQVTKVRLPLHLVGTTDTSIEFYFAQCFLRNHKISSLDASPI
jgi:hypothetical protein